MVGTATSSVTQVGCQFDYGSVITATGTTNWSCQLPSGGSTWKMNSSHTITVGIKSGASLSGTTSISVTKGNNKDINGDGYPDAVVGGLLYSTGTGAAYIFYGGSGGVSSTPVTTLIGQATPEGFGSSIALGDLNGDGFADVVVGAYDYNTATGAVYIYNGGSGGVSTTPTTTLTGTSYDELFGCSVAVGDINGDGYTDLVVGVSGYSSGTGEVLIYNGASGGISTAPSGSSLAPPPVRDLVGPLRWVILMVTDMRMSWWERQATVPMREITYNGTSGYISSPTTILTGPSSGEGFGSSLAVGDVNWRSYCGCRGGSDRLQFRNWGRVMLIRVLLGGCQRLQPPP